MKKAILGCLLTLPLIASWTQDLYVPLALPEGGRALFVNHASSLLLHSPNLAVSVRGPSTAWEAPEKFNILSYLLLGFPGYLQFSYELRRIDQKFYLGVGMGMPLGESVKVAYRQRWLGLTYDLSKLQQEVSSIIMIGPWGLLASNLFWDENQSWELKAGLALRPLGSFDFGHRFQLFADIQSTESQPISFTGAGVQVLPVEGWVVQAGYLHQPKPSLQISMSFRYSYAETGYATALDLSQPNNLGPKDLFAHEAWLALSFWREGRPMPLPAVRRLIFVQNADVIYETRPPLFTSRFGGVELTQPGLVLSEFLTRLEEYARDPYVEALVFENQALVGSFDQLMSLRKALSQFKQSGKKIYFRYERMGFEPYLVAAGLADRISLDPLGSLDLRNQGFLLLYLGEFLKRFGVEVIGYQSHPEKTAVNTLTLGAPSPQERELYLRLAAQFRRLILEVLKTRSLNLSAEQALDGGPYEAVEPSLRNAGLVDVLENSSAFANWLRSVHPNHDRITLNTPLRTTEWGKSPKTRLAVVYALGNIVEGRGSFNTIGHLSLIKQLQRAFEDPTYQGVIMRVDSGGGSILASDAIAKEILDLKQRFPNKPFYISMGGVAASGGYYIAAPADKIFASESTLTGSIGVVGLSLSLQKLLEENRIGLGRFSEGDNFDTNSLFRAPTTAERQRTQNLIKQYYEVFANFVAKNRNLTTEELEKAAQARVWTGREALALKLVDALGELQDAASDMARRLKIENFELVSVLSDLEFVEVLGEMAVKVLGEEFFASLRNHSSHSIQGLLEGLWQQLKSIQENSSLEVYYLYLDPLFWNLEQRLQGR
jgi:protease-4